MSFKNAENFWKVAIIAHTETREQIDDAIIRLHGLGLDQIHVFASPMVRVNKKWDIVVHQQSAWRSGYVLWRDTFQILSKTYASQTGLFLFIRPGVWLWEQLPAYCEFTIPMEQVGFWSPFTPNRVFPDEHQQRPQCKPGFGWCKCYLNSSFVANHCLVATSHSITLAAAYLPEESELGLNVPGSIGVSFTKHLIPTYFHLPSLVGHVDDSLLADDFVGVAYKHDQKQMKTTFLERL